ncbi:MAG: hypothetical protein U9N59_01170 [Campylobacterota bacterium]|nr:hypothetical protein [Campylobacterota bacterium]
MSEEEKLLKEYTLQLIEKKTGIKFPNHKFTNDERKLFEKYYSELTKDETKEIIELVEEKLKKPFIMTEKSEDIFRNIL